MVSFGAKLDIGAVTRMSAPTALPRSTALTEAVAGIGAGAGVVGAGSVATGGSGAGSSFFLQPTSAALPIIAASMAIWRRLVFMGIPFMSYGEGMRCDCRAMVSPAGSSAPAPA